MKITLTDDAGVEVVFVPAVKVEEAVSEAAVEDTVLPESTEPVQPVE